VLKLWKRTGRQIFSEPAAERNRNTPKRSVHLCVLRHVAELLALAKHFAGIPDVVAICQAISSPII